MKSIRSFTLLKLATASLLAICFNAGLATAQTAGKFTMPFEAHWGQATLPAGDYSFKLEELPTGHIVHLFQGTKNVAYIVNQSFDRESTGPISLTVIRNSAGNTVRDLSLPEIGVVLHYGPKPGRSAAEEREIAKRIPITTSGQ
jgi:hypothetical protein